MMLRRRLLFPILLLAYVLPVRVEADRIQPPLPGTIELSVLGGAAGITPSPRILLGDVLRLNVVGRVKLPANRKPVIQYFAAAADGPLRYLGSSTAAAAGDFTGGELRTEFTLPDEIRRRWLSSEGFVRAQALLTFVPLSLEAAAGRSPESILSAAGGLRSAVVEFELVRPRLRLTVPDSIARGSEQRVEAYLDVPAYAENYPERVHFDIVGEAAAALPQIAPQEVKRISVRREFPTVLTLAVPDNGSWGSFALRGEALLAVPDESSQLIDALSWFDVRPEQGGEEAGMRILSLGLYEDRLGRSPVRELSSGMKIFVVVRSSVPEEVQQYQLSLAARLDEAELGGERLDGTGSRLPIEVQLPLTMPREAQGRVLTVRAVLKRRIADARKGVGPPELELMRELHAAVY